MLVHLGAPGVGTVKVVSVLPVRFATCRFGMVCEISRIMIYDAEVNWIVVALGYTGRKYLLVLYNSSGLHAGQATNGRSSANMCRW